MRRDTSAIATAAAIAAVAIGANVAGAAIGELDGSFSGDGKLVRNVDQGVAEDVVTDSMNRILVTGPFSDAGADDFAVARYLPSGAIDRTFGGGDGFFTLDLGSTPEEDRAEAIALDPQGRVLVGGHSGNLPDTKTVVVRLTPAGAVDPSFGGGDGIFLENLDPGDPDQINELAVDSSARVVAAGQIGPAASPNALVLRLTPQGGLDTSGFSAPDGFESVNVNSVASNDRAFGVGIDPAGRIVIGGETEIAAQEQNFFAARFLTNGTLDASFKSLAPIPGRSIVDVSAGVPPNQSDGAEAVAIDSSGRPVLAGFAETGTSSGPDMALLRLTTGGIRDTSFSGDGAAFVDFGGTEAGTGVAIDGAGRPVLVGLGDTGPAEFAVARFLVSGSPDTSFSGDGRINTAFGGITAAARAVAIDRGGRPVVAGSFAPVPMQTDWALARYEGVPRCGGKVPTLTGTPSKDKLRGTRGKDVISGGKARDRLFGLGRADVLCGEAGRDRLLGGKGPDRLLGGRGRDRLLGGPGRDRLRGGPGRDRQKQ